MSVCLLSWIYIANKLNMSMALEIKEADSNCSVAAGEHGQAMGHRKPPSLFPASIERNDNENRPSYPTGIKLFMIGLGLCLAVVCSNLVVQTHP